MPDECAVCFVAFEPGDALKALPCGHAGFHLKCIRTWLQRSPTCPLCRCACRCRGPRGRPRGPPGDLGDADVPGDPDLRSETFERRLAELTAMHEEGERVARPAGGSAEAKRDRRIRRCVSERDARPIRCPRPRGYPWGP